ADPNEAFWIKSDGHSVTAQPIPDGLSMITSRDLNSTGDSSRMRFHLGRFRSAPAPDPETGDWDAWKALLGSRDTEPGSSFRGAMNVASDYGFGTVSSSLIALPAYDRVGVEPQWFFCNGRPDQAAYEPVDI
ncbi:MAG: hypothetical protein VW405_09930, partial [Rhodospirillaceae bacterium]